MIQVDDVDFDLLLIYTWNTKSHKYVVTYKRVENKTVRIYLHKLIAKRMGYDCEMDHIDRNRYNCKRDNLRPCTRSQNSINKDILSTNTSGYKGVCYHVRINKWQARLGHKNTRKHLGYFNTPEEAAKAYDAAAKQYFGEFAFLNFP